MTPAASSICWARDSLDVAMEKARNAGFTAFEPLTFPGPEIFPLHGDLRQISAGDLQPRFKAHGLTPAALHLGAIMTPTEGKRRALTDYAKLAIDVAHAIGCPQIVEGGPDRASEPFAPFLKSLEELIPHAEQAGVRISLENHAGNWIQYIQDYEHIFQHVRSPILGITLDTGHFHAAGVDPIAVARKFAPMIFHVHMKDHKGHESVGLGEGDIDNAGVIEELRRNGYAGYVSEELELHDPTRADQAAHEGYGYLKGLIEANEA